MTPKPLRKGTVLAFLNAYVTPLVFTYQSFLKFRKAKLYQLMITPQVCYLERLLRDRFDFTLRRIEIEDAIWHSPWYLYQEAELKPEYLFIESENQPVFLYTDNEAGSIKDDFVVLVPQDIVFDDNEMRSIINSYRLAGKRYKIERV